MATNHPSDESSCCAEEAIGPFATYEELAAHPRPGNPLAFEADEDLFWHDGPIVSVGATPGDDRPRLDVVVDETGEGAAPGTVFTTRRHQLVFADRETLDATLHHGCAPTRATYRAAAAIVVHETRSTHVDSPDPAHSAKWTRVDAADLPEAELPPPGLEPDGRGGAPGGDA